MKNKFILLASVMILLMVILGCGVMNPFSGGSDGGSSNKPIDNKTTTDRVVDSTVGEERIGIEECDQIVDELAGQTKSKDEGYIVKAFRQYYVNMIRESVRKSIEENKNDPEKLRTECKKIRVQLDKFQAEEESKKNQ